MSNLLLLDDSEVAGRAMRGITGRSGNRCVVTTSVEEAWTQLCDLVVIDLVVVEIKLHAGDGTAFIKRLRENLLFKNVPVVVYTSEQNHALAASVRSLNIQNYSIKPYHDEVILEEIAKAESNPWRSLQFEEDHSFCVQLGLKPDALRKMRVDLLDAIRGAAASLRSDGSTGLKQAIGKLTPLSDPAQSAGFWGLFEYLQDLENTVEAGKDRPLDAVLSDLECAARLLHARVNPDDVPEALISDSERREKEEAVERARWTEADVDANGPATDPDQVMEKVDAFVTCPVIDTIGAEFTMATESKSPNVQHVMSLVGRDPGISAAVLIAANRLDRGDVDPVDDPSVAAGLLGNLALSTLARSLPLVEERFMNVPPISWSQFWLFQMGVAAVSLHTARQLEFEMIQEHAYTAGLLHDIGKLLLLKIHPYGFKAMVNYAARKSIPLHQAETAYMGCTSRDIAYRFCEKHPLPAHYANVIRWVEHPEKASEDLDLVAVVSLARTFCMHHHVGYCGDTPKDECPPVEETAAWQVLRNRVYPSFNITRFDHAIRNYCAHLKQELLGKAH
jgi:HD-like signal output (HDOD) protein/CheY-like chemotaxis protein